VSFSFQNQLSGVRLAGSVLLVVFLSCVCGCVSHSSNYENQLTFKTPEDAVTALVSAAKAKETTELEALLGSNCLEVVSSGDPVADRRQREVLSVALNERWSLESTNGSDKELVIGHENWPYPIPLVQDHRGWWFDTHAGKQEILARRIGRNELWSIAALQTFVTAQETYASVGHDGNAAGIYAQQIRSDAGKRNGLYWPVTSSKETPSPFAIFAAAAMAEGYGTQAKELQAPYRGYFYRILTRQGPDAPGGERDYIVNGHMTGGFAMIAWPADYGNSGIMTFMVGPDGVVYESDLGPDTLAIAGAIQSFSPAANWSKAE
jgi:hypothetical protein